MREREREGKEKGQCVYDHKCLSATYASITFARMPVFKVKEFMGDIHQFSLGHLFKKHI